MTASWRAVFDAATSGRLDFTPVRISLGTPKFWPDAASAPYVHELAPAGLLRTPRLAPDEFDRLFRERLDRFGVERIVARLDEVASEHGGRPLVLVCFERDPADCHRSLVARWLEERTGVVVPEAELPGTTAQLTLDQGGDR